jgi:ATP-binding protein involved in chromosome partitioning
MTTPQRELTPEEQTRVEALKRNWEQQRRLKESLDSTGKRIGVYSGKGGVGKTTVAVNLAVSLARDGAKVGLFDCDIDCPNVTRVMHLSDAPVAEGENAIVPPSRFGVSVMSMSFFQQDEEEATIWRGPMIHNAINQFLTMTKWGELDYMVVDLPPGTSDAPLTVMQTFQMNGFVVVTTPQELAVLDAKRSINMIRKMNLEVIGIVENFSGDFFGRGGGKELADEMGIPFLGSIEMRADYLGGTMPMALAVDRIGEEFRHIADGVRHRLAALSSAK